MVGTYYNNPINQAAPARGDLIVGNAGGLLTAVTAGSAGKVLISAGVGTLPTWETAGSSGKLIQQIYTQRSDLVQCTTVFPIDNTIPVKTEGAEVFTLTITPTSASNYLIIQGVLMGNVSTGAAGAIFQDDTSNALTAFYLCYSTTMGCPVFYTMVAGTTSATTFKIRCGPDSGGGTWALNGYNSSTRMFGGVCMSYMMISEVSA